MTVDDKDNERRSGRASLVERAAEKLGAEDLGASVDSALDASLVERTGGSVIMPDPPRPEAEAPDFVPPVEPDPPPAGANGAHPVHENGIRSVELDFNRLESQGIMTPNNTRTRTTEEFRLIKRTVLTNRWRAEVPNPNLIMVTSAVPGEGKTFSAMNLAMSIASEKDLSVLLIDCDLTKPTISSRFGISAQRGLIDVLEDDSLDLADVMIKTNVEGLTVIPAGAPPIAMNPELLASDRMKHPGARHGRALLPIGSSCSTARRCLATTEPTVLAEQRGSDHLRRRGPQDAERGHQIGDRADQHRARDRHGPQQGRRTVRFDPVRLILLLLQAKMIDSWFQNETVPWPDCTCSHSSR